MGTASTAAWEYRIWPDKGDEIFRDLQRGLDFREEPPRTDIYFMREARGETSAQAKLRRESRLNIKELLGREDGLELWRPVMKSDLPLDDEDRATLHRLYPDVSPALTTLEAARDAFRDKAREVTVKKVRHMCREEAGLRAEIATALVDGKELRTFCLEHPDQKELARAVDQFGFRTWPNTSYTAFLSQRA